MNAHGLSHNHTPSVIPMTGSCDACFWEEKFKNPGLTTFTGRHVHPLNLQPEDIDIRDIAHHLACTNRWCGALKVPISVAQHSVHVMRLCQGTGFELEALLHDATEAYLGDVSKWVKSHASMEFYRQAEHNAALIITQVFGTRAILPPEVERADRMMINIEGSLGFKEWRSMPGFPVPTPADLNRCKLVTGWTWAYAEQAFLHEFKRYTRTK